MALKRNKKYLAIADYYDAEFDQLETVQGDVPFFMEHAGHSRRSILELCAGTGRVAIPLAQAGHRVTGIDIADDMLAIARHKRDTIGLTDRQLPLITADALTLDLHQRFDWVCLFFNTFLNFTTLDEQDQLLQTVCRHMKPRGRFWLDVYQPNLELLVDDHTTGLQPAAFYVPSLNRTVYRVTDVQRDTSAQVQHVTFRYEWFDEHGEKHEQAHRFNMTFMFPRELQLLLERNGLQIEHLWGDYDGSLLSAHSPRMVVQAKLR